MRRALALAAALALALTSCATFPDGYPKARGSTERIEAAYLVVRGPAEKAIARLPEPARSRAAAVLILADAALVVVRSDATPLARAAAARQLVRAATILVGLGSALRASRPISE